MRSEFIHAEPGDSLLQAAQIMQLARIRHLPVLETGRLVGLISHRDILEHTEPCLEGSEVERRALLRDIPVSRVMHTAVHCVAPEASLAEAAEKLLRYKIGCLPVVVSSEAGPRMVGLITESDLLGAAYLPAFDARTLEPRPRGDC